MNESMNDECMNENVGHVSLQSWVKKTESLVYEKKEIA